MLGAGVLVLYGIIPTLQRAHFGRVYAAYGGIFIVLSLLWGWKIDAVAPDTYDVIGGLIALLGGCVIRGCESGIIASRTRVSYGMRGFAS